MSLSGHVMLWCVRPKNRPYIILFIFQYWRNCPRSSRGPLPRLRGLPAHRQRHRRKPGLRAVLEDGYASPPDCYTRRAAGRHQANGMAVEDAVLW